MASEVIELKSSPRTDKDIAIDAIRRLPDHVTLTQIQVELEPLAAIRRGREEILRGEFVTHEDAKARLEEWLSK